MESTFDSLYYTIIQNSRYFISLQKEKPKSRNDILKLYDILIQAYAQMNSLSEVISKKNNEELIESLYMFSTYLSGSLIYKSYGKRLSVRETKLQSLLESFLVIVERYLDEDLQSQNPIF